MKAAWFRKLGRNLSTTPSLRPDRRISHRNSLRPIIEKCEIRLMPATITWINVAGGDWDTAANWSGGALPGVNDDVVISQPGNITITHSLANVDSVHSVTSTDTLKLSNGTLSVTANLSNTGTFTIVPGATLTNATLASGTTLTATGGTLSGITIASGGNLAVTSGIVTVTSGMTVNGHATVGTSSGLSFSGTQTLGGSGDVKFTFVAQTSVPNLSVATTGTTLTIGAGLLVHGNDVFIGSTNGVPVSDRSIINNGTIRVDVPSLTNVVLL